jgi:glycine dehydrogenase
VSTDQSAIATFADRHIGPRADDIAKMLAAVGLASLNDLADAVVPGDIRSVRELSLPPAGSEAEVLSELRAIAAQNRPTVSMIGQGWNDTVTPSVIRRAILENPAWYTAYTPYQPEISQGRLEALLTFQTTVADLTGLAVANASLLDEATAAAEVMSLSRRVSQSTSRRFVVDSGCHPQTLAVLAARAEPLGVDLDVVDLGEVDPAAVGECFGALVATPTTLGTLRDPGPLAEAVHGTGGLVAVTTDLLALTLCPPPGGAGADIAVGSAQRFGVPLGFGGPHAGFMAVRAGLERALPGRLVGVSVDADGAPAYRLALQTREQHIRREKATSNICTAQVLLAVIAGAYAVYHGPEGLRGIAERIHGHAARLHAALGAGGVEVLDGPLFDTVTARVPGRARAVVAAAADHGITLRRVDEDTVSVAADETTIAAHIDAVCAAFGVDAAGLASPSKLSGPRRQAGGWLTHPVFHEHRSETALMRYLRRLADRDLALDRTMIPLGSCTMKLNAAAEMEPITWPEFARIHPFAPAGDSAGHRRVIADLQAWLAEITGYAAVSLQPNAGSQGEFAGLLAIRAYHRSRGEAQRDVCLIPASAHGTNAASAAMAGMRVVVVACDENGNVSLDDLRAKLTEHGERVSAVMITYPSTHGVFETAIREICDAVHAAGGQVYVDGANLNALVGVSRPGDWGADVSHLNLHKTFCIPHGGGGPGVGPVAVREHLAAFLPRHPADDSAGPASGVGPVSGAPYGSAGILPIPWAYVRLMGADGLTKATLTATLAANYVAKRLAGHYPVLYSGSSGLVAHECILDLRPITKQTGVTAEDVAKRLIDYGLHAPTMSFPVAGTLMVEPTESEDLAELDRFCDAMLAIREEIERVASGEWSLGDSPLRRAPHTARSLLGDWDLPYSREEAGYPMGSRRSHTVDKYWPPVRRIDQGYGDRNLQCSCPPIEAYAD